MPRWVAFAALTLLVLTILLLSARRSGQLVGELASEPTERPRLPDGADHLAGIETSTSGQDSLQVSKTALLANVAVTHGLFALVLLAGVVIAAIPLPALGIGSAAVSGREAVAVGIATGLGIAVVNTLAGAIADAFEADPSGPLRELLAPDSRRGWLALLFVVLPIIAGFEELLFRGALIGAFAVGFDLSPWMLAVGSSVVFGAGHGAQGRVGIAATGLLGFALAAVFVTTGSLLVVWLAHYVVNAVEFVLVEGIGYEPFGG